MYFVEAHVMKTPSSHHGRLVVVIVNIIVIIVVIVVIVISINLVITSQRISVFQSCIGMSAVVHVLKDIGPV